MPELPDIELYLHALRPRILGKGLLSIRLASPFLLRTVVPTPSELANREITELARLGKRLVLGLEDDYFAVIHLMIAGRLQWRAQAAKVPRRLGLAAFDFADGTLVLTEAGSKKRASLHLVRGREALEKHDPGGLDVLDCDFESFRQALQQRNHTLKRALTDPRILSGIGNAYSDEILHHVQMSPFLRTAVLNDAALDKLLDGCREILLTWKQRLISQAGERFPSKVTAFHEEMAVHGRYRKPCPRCSTPVQRILYVGREANYCALCQTGGRVLADRVLSRILKGDWPKRIEDLEWVWREPST